MPPVADLHDALAAIVGADQLLTDGDMRAGYERDLTGRFTGTAVAVVRPASAAECAAVVAACAERSVPIIARGGGTGLVGGAVPQNANEVVLSLERLDALDEAADGTDDLLAGAGVRLQAVQEAARARGLEFPLDFGARSAATVGGMTATNAAGPLALRHGPMRARLAGLEAVLASGRIVSRLSGLKDTAGYDWGAVLIGSEGTLAIITRARLRLTRPPAARAVALFGCASVPETLALLQRLRAALGPQLEAADFSSAAGLELVRARRRLAEPLARTWPWYLTVQVGAEDPVSALDAALGSDAIDVAVADSTSGRTALWAYRDGLNEAINAEGVPHKFDVSVPLAAIPGFLDAADAAVGRLDPAARIIHYGHLGDGNLHVNVLGLAPADERADDVILRLVAAHRGSISAEHGIGIAKRGWLGLTRSEAELATMRALKGAFDPHGLLAPGRVLP